MSWQRYIIQMAYITLHVIEDDDNPFEYAEFDEISQTPDGWVLQNWE